MTGGQGDEARARALAVLLEIAERVDPRGRNVMARVAAAKAILESQPKPLSIPGWSPAPTPEAPPELEDDGTWGESSH